MGASGMCWAVDCIDRDGKYYFYFSNGNSQTGVLVGDTPAGPFRDVLGKPLLDGTLTPTREYDPALFRDDDGEYYLVFGGPAWAYGPGNGYYIARLNPDMISLAEPPRAIELNHEADDKASLNKFGGKYYLSFGGFYAVSDCVYGPYEYAGHTGASIDHTSYTEWNGQLFNAITITDHKYAEHRATGLCYVHIRENGELCTDPMIVEYGVGKYDGDWNRIEAEWYMAGENVRKVENKDLFGFSVACTQEAALTYPSIRNVGDKMGFHTSGSCRGGGTIELRENSRDGRLLGVVDVPDRGYPFTWHNRACCNMRFSEPLPETLNLCLVLKPNEGAEMWLDCFHFIAPTVEGE